MPKYSDMWGQTPYSASQSEKRKWAPSGAASDLSKRSRALMASPGRSMAPQANSGLSQFDQGLVSARGDIATTEDMGANRGLGSGMLGASEDYRHRERALGEMMRRRKFAEVAQQREAQKEALRRMLGIGAQAGGMAMGIPPQVSGAGADLLTGLFI